MAQHPLPSSKKLCFVTIGATASFDSLIKAALSQHFLEALQKNGYTNLLLQHGKEGGKILEDFQTCNYTGEDQRYKLGIAGFDFNRKGLGEEMRAAKGTAGGLEGVVISHAGTPPKSKCTIIC